MLDIRHHQKIEGREPQNDPADIDRQFFCQRLMAEQDDGAADQRRGQHGFTGR